MKFTHLLIGSLNEGAPQGRTISPWEQEEDSSALGSRGVGCSSIWARRFARKSFPRVELELPEGDISWEVMHSCNTWIMTGGRGTTVLATMAHCFSSWRCSFFFIAFLKAQTGSLHCFIATFMRSLTLRDLCFLHKWRNVIRSESWQYEGALPFFLRCAALKIAQISSTELYKQTGPMIPALKQMVTFGSCLIGVDRTCPLL